MRDPNKAITAIFVRPLPSWRSEAHLYKLSEPVVYTNEWDDEQLTTEYVIVSAAHLGIIDEVETYIFPANPDGTAINMSEMEGSCKGTLDHHEAIRRAGWHQVNSL
jgi:hypothetical protein